jgi:hypothetical protein
MGTLDFASDISSYSVHWFHLDKSIEMSQVELSFEFWTLPADLAIHAEERGNSLDQVFSQPKKGEGQLPRWAIEEHCISTRARG